MNLYIYLENCYLTLFYWFVIVLIHKYFDKLLFYILLRITEIQIHGIVPKLSNATVASSLKQFSYSAPSSTIC